MVMKATVLPRVLPSTQKEIDDNRDRFEREVEALLHDRKLRFVRLEPNVWYPNTVFLTFMTTYYFEVVTSLEKTEVDPNRLTLSTGITLTAHNRNNRELKAAMGYLYWQLLYQRQIMREDYVASYGIIPLPYTQRTEDMTKPAIGQRRLRVGFVSRYIFNSAVGLYMSELIPMLDRIKYEIVVFAIGQSKSMKVVKQIEAITETVSTAETSKR
ncbi:unnamed protein product [Phytophthora fragariaefolia]|uniref:Unnamed protein product n=1 Tax=Phytophthora fragariaefolia TaxID=1490495 RepID=A0A9W6XQI0_9STRA|nr:unnamed protein product [Phytophthora fragariaefolia]